MVMTHQDKNSEFLNEFRLAKTKSAFITKYSEINKELVLLKGNVQNVLRKMKLTKIFKHCDKNQVTKNGKL